MYDADKIIKGCVNEVIKDYNKKRECDYKIEKNRIMKRVKIYFFNRECKCIENCRSIDALASDYKCIKVETDERTYVFNMSAIEYYEVSEVASSENA